MRHDLFIPRVPALAGVLSAVLAGCGGGPPQGPPPRPAPTVTTATPLRKRVVEWDRYIGRIEAVREVDIRAKVTGYLKSIHFRDGQMVEVGDLLFVIDPRPFESEVDRAEAAVAEALATLSRTRAGVSQAKAQRQQADSALELAATQEARAARLEQQGALPEAERDVAESRLKQSGADRLAADAAVELAEAEVRVAEANVETARSRLKTANIQLGYTRIAAPIAGRVSAHRVSEGNLIIEGGSGEALTTIVSVDPVHVVFDANEREFLKYVRLDRAGKRASSREAKNPVLVGLVDEAGFPHEGHMDFVDNRVDRGTGTIRGRAILPNPDGDLTPGLFARVRLPGSEPYEAILIPDAALATDQTEQFVYVVVDGNPGGSEGSPAVDTTPSEASAATPEEPETVRGQSPDDAGAGGPPPEPTHFVERRVVKLGPPAYGLRIVREGLDGSETIVIDGTQALRPSAGVNVRPGSVEATEGDGLPSTYEPWPKERWLSVDGPAAGDPPLGAAPNAEPATIGEVSGERQMSREAGMNEENGLSEEAGGG